MKFKGNVKENLNKQLESSILEKFTDEQLDEFRELFQMFDRSSQGKIFEQMNKFEMIFSR